MTDARQFAVEFFRHWQPIINFVVPAEMVADLEDRASGLLNLLPPIDPNQPIRYTNHGAFEYKPKFDGSTGTPPSDQAGFASPPVPGTNQG